MGSGLVGYLFLNFVLQGFSTVLESGIGAPDPEELAKASKENEAKRLSTPEQPMEKVEKEDETKGSGGDAFQFGSLLSGVTKFVESTGKDLNTSFE